VGRQTAEGLSDYFIDTLAKCLRNENAIELGLEDFQMIDRVDSADLNFVPNHIAPAEIRIAIASYQITFALNQ
jgi:hypothetical protein